MRTCMRTLCNLKAKLNWNEIFWDGKYADIEKRRLFIYFIEYFRKQNYNINDRFFFGVS